MSLKRIMGPYSSLKLCHLLLYMKFIYNVTYHVKYGFLFQLSISAYLKTMLSTLERKYLFYNYRCLAIMLSPYKQATTHIYSGYNIYSLFVQVCAVITYNTAKVFMAATLLCVSFNKI